MASLLFLLVVSARGQTIEGRVVLPDSAGVVGVSRLAVCDTAQGRVFYGGVGAVGVMAGPEGRRVERIDVEGRVNHYTHGLYLDQGLSRFCTLAGLDTLIEVIDTRADSIVETIALPYGMVVQNGEQMVCLNTQDHKLYAVVGLGKTAVFDIAAGTFLRVFELAPDPVGMCYNPRSNKVYANCNNKVWVRDGATDSLLNIVPAGNGATYLGHLGTHNKVYVTNTFGDDVTVIDGAGDSLVCTIQVPGGPGGMTTNETDGKV